MIEVICKFLNKEITAPEFEDFVYRNPNLESELGETVYYRVIEFNYKSKHVFSEIQGYFLKELNQEKEFKEWKIKRLLKSVGIRIPEDNLFQVVNNNLHFFKTAKITIVNHYWSRKLIEIIWNNKAIQFELKFPSQKMVKSVIKIGHFDNGYVDIIINRKGEIWFLTNIDEKLHFGGGNFSKAISRIVFEEYYE